MRQSRQLLARCAERVRPAEEPYPQGVVPADRPVHTYMRVVAKLTEFVAARARRPIQISELCAALGVSDTTLRRCCRQHLGMGPIRYIWLRRMELAREALSRADHAKTTVTAIAMDHGFWELGRFSVEYRSLFGEPPSATLGRVNACRRARRHSDARLSSTASLPSSLCYSASADGRS